MEEGSNYAFLGSVDQLQWEPGGGQTTHFTQLGRCFKVSRGLSIMVLLLCIGHTQAAPDGVPSSDIVHAFQAMCDMDEALRRQQSETTDQLPLLTTAVDGSMG